MSTKKTFEELCKLKQLGKITWLEFVSESEYSEEFSEWCVENGLAESDDTAFLFLEWKDSQTFDNYTPLETLSVFFV